MAYVLTFPTPPPQLAERLVACSPGGRSSVESALRELRAAGWLYLAHQGGNHPRGTTYQHGPEVAA